MNLIIITPAGPDSKAGNRATALRWQQLLQQAGQADEAAGHWSELIAYDDSQATWWLGLAIALETGGRINSAVRAYAQAAVLPGLAPSLADYARERLNALQAGS